MFNGPEDILLLVGVVLLLIFFTMSLRKRSRRDTGMNVSARQNLARLRETESVRTDLEALMVEIEQMARRLSNTLDNKSARLEALIDEADQKLHALQQAQPHPPHAAPERSEGAGTAPPPPPAAPSQLVQDPLTQRIHALADEGLDAAAIARETNEYIGKVELVLSLRHA